MASVYFSQKRKESNARYSEEIFVSPKESVLDCWDTYLVLDVSSYGAMKPLELEEDGKH